MVPTSSSDLETPRFTWWDRVGTTEWVEVDLGTETVVRNVGVYWFDDEPVGGRCRTPRAWRLQALSSAGEWKDVTARGTYGVRRDRMNTVAIEPISTRKLRIVADLKKNMSSGILEWQINATR